MHTVVELEARLAQPSPALVEAMARLDGDIMVLGVGGKMGPSLARLAVNAIRAAGVTKRVIGVARFSARGLAEDLGKDGVETIAADLLNEAALRGLPQAPNIIYMAGQKFGTSGAEHLTWAMNTYLPGRVADTLRGSRFVVFSTGNVYPLTPVALGGPVEETPPAPVGEYAQSCLGREQVFRYFSHVHGTPVLLFRLNYANDLRYGVLLDVARAVWEQRPIDLRMGYVNVIWQGDANEYALRSLALCTSPPTILNVSGPETVAIRWLAERFGEVLGVRPQFSGMEAETALLTNASRAHRLFGYPRVSLRQIIEWTAEWVRAGAPTLDKPTHFQQRDGKF
jgi:nucleoside-diphosphate-sugar epimerase